MNLIDIKLKQIRNEKRMGLMTHVVVGYPSLKETISLVEVMDQKCADFVELQIPFSDPLADGPTIMKACEDSLERGTKVQDAFSVAKKLSSKVKIPLLFMAYYNTVFKYGVEKFCKDARESGISGLIIPDMPLEEENNEGFSESAKLNKLYVIRVISPASTLERIKMNIKNANGFIYCTSRQGTTGSQKQFDPKVIKYMKSVKELSSIPLALGFGVTNRYDADLGYRYADIIVVGSAIVRIAEIYRGEELKRKVGEFVTSLRV